MKLFKNNQGRSQPILHLSQRFSISLAALFIALFMLSCSDSLNKGNVTALHSSSPNLNFEGDAQLGASSVSVSPHFSIPRANAGGSYFKKKVTSSHFVVTGGISSGP